MIFFAALMMWAYSYNEYKRPAGTPATRIWRPLWDRYSISSASTMLQWFWLGALSASTTVRSFLHPIALSLTRFVSADFAREIWGSFIYFINRKKYDAQKAEWAKEGDNTTFASAFNIEGSAWEQKSAFLSAQSPVSTDRRSGAVLGQNSPMSAVIPQDKALNEKNAADL